MRMQSSRIPGLAAVALLSSLVGLAAPSPATAGCGCAKPPHRQLDAFNTDDDPNWHADGTPHVNHNLIVVAIRGRLANGTTPVPGATPPFQLVITSAPTE